MPAPLPSFKKQPDEISVFSPGICRWLDDQGLQTVDVNGLFDLLVTGTTDSIDKYLELKVCLQSQSWSIPISKKQWYFMRGHPEVIENRARVLIYDSNEDLYSISAYSSLVAGLARKKPNTTSYIRAASYMNENLCWYDPLDAAYLLEEWMNGT